MVIVLIALFAAVTTPRLLAMRDGADLRAFRWEAENVFQAAREAAISRGRPVRVALAEGSGAIQAVDQAGGESGQDLTVSSAEFPVGVSLIAVRRSGTEVDLTTWEVWFYPDGTATEAAAQFDIAGEPLSVTIAPGTAIVHATRGELPEPGQDTWEAGELEQRA